VSTQCLDSVLLIISISIHLQLQKLFFFWKCRVLTLSKGCHLDVVRGPSTAHDPESDAGGSLSSWQRHPSR
jgi:hypothetical protein